MHLRKSTCTVNGIAADFWECGKGDPLLLVHGGWGSAQSHWASIWSSVGERYTVFAPELPGIAYDGTRALPSYGHYVQLLADFVKCIGIERAAVVGNSLGATLSWGLGSAFPDLIRQVILVNGFPQRPLPRPLRHLSTFRPARYLLTRALQNGFYSPKAAKLAFHSLANVPEEILANLSSPPRRMIEAMLRLLLSADTAVATPRIQTDFIWGASDRLSGLTLAVGRDLHQKVRGSRLRVVEAAGHLPQIENPEQFVSALYDLL